MYEQLWKESINIKDFQSSLLWSRLCLGGANLIPKQVEHLRKEEKEKKKKEKTENAEAEFTFFVCAQEVREMVAPVLKSFQAQVSRMSLFFFFFLLLHFTDTWNIYRFSRIKHIGRPG